MLAFCNGGNAQQGLQARQRRGSRGGVIAHFDPPADRYGQKFRTRSVALPRPQDTFSDNRLRVLDLPFRCRVSLNAGGAVMARVPPKPVAPATSNKHPTMPTTPDVDPTEGRPMTDQDAGCVLAVG